MDSGKLDVNYRHLVVIAILSIIGGIAGIALGKNADTMLLGDPLKNWPSTGRFAIRMVVSTFGFLGGAVGLPMLAAYFFRHLREQR